MPPRITSLFYPCIVLAAVMAWVSLRPGPTDATRPDPASKTAAINRLPPTSGAPDAVRGNEPEEAAGPLDPDFLQRALAADGKSVTIPLPGGEILRGSISKSRSDVDGPLMIEGEIAHPHPGRFYFHRQTVVGRAGALFGFTHFKEGDTAYQVRPDGPGGSPVLVRTTVDQVMCRAYAAPPGTSGIPAAHPTDDPIPEWENGIIQLQSLPGATAVVYLDFDGEQRDFEYWGPIDAAHSGASNEQIFEVWQGVCEDFMPFQINVTTIRSVFEAAPLGHRMQVIVTPTDAAQPGAGGVAITGSFSNMGEIVCWSFVRTGKNAIEVISHEVGHTLGLSHDGKSSPFAEYFTGVNGWAPIMGISYGHPLSQWSKGEYLNANNSQDDLQIIASNNGVGFRADDHAGAASSATWLNIDASGVVSGEGIIETSADRDSFRFSTHGGDVELSINPAPLTANGVAPANLDIRAELLRVTSSLTTVIPTTDTSPGLSYSFSEELDPGDYVLRIRGTGRGIPLVTGYSNYASLGAYTISGTVEDAVHNEHFTLAENSPYGTPVGSVPPRADHDGGSLIYQIEGGDSAFSIHPDTGLITVADASLLDFEARSARWDDPADFELFVTISDSLDFAVETIRVVIVLTDVNEPPVLPTPPAIALPERSPAGTVAAVIRATDPDRGDYIRYSITSGNIGGVFAIHPATGVVTVEGSLDHVVESSYALTIRASDHLTPAQMAETTLDIQILPLPAGFEPGSVVRTFYSGIAGAAVTDLTSAPNFPNRPNSEVILGSFDGGSGQGVDYGSTIRGFLIAPASGDYTFWISANDSATLLLSTDADPLNSSVIASVGSPTAPGVWNAEPGQQSSTIPLVAGGVYYIEGRHKQSGGSAHFQVAWQGPGMTERQIIPGIWLAPYHQPYAPWAPPRTFVVREKAVEGTLVDRVHFIEPNLAEQVVSHAITAGAGQDKFTIDPLTGDIRVAEDAELDAGSSHVIEVSATDDATPPDTGTTSVTIQVRRLDEGLRAWWKLDETGGTTAFDSSGNQRHAELTGGGTWVSRDAGNYALELNGTDARLSRQDFEGLFGPTPFTVAAWVRVPAAHASSGTLFHQSNGTAGGIEQSVKISINADGHVGFLVRETNLDLLDETVQFNLTSTEPIDDGSWHHIACVRDGGTGRIFIDGVESASGSGPVIHFDLNVLTSVGADAFSGGGFLEAKVDDIRVYDEALAAPQITRIAGAPKITIIDPTSEIAVTPPGVGLWLEAAASDPDGPTPAISWSLVDGPGLVTFGDSASARTTVRFSAPGTYTVRATASDGGDDASDTLIVEAGNTASSAFAGHAYGVGTTGSFSQNPPQVFLLQGVSSGILGDGVQDGLFLAGQNFAGDFDLRTRVTGTFDEGFGGPWGIAGLAVRAGTTGQADEPGGFIGYNEAADTGLWIRRNTPGGPNAQSTFPGMTLPGWCRITRQGDTVEFWHSTDGAAWTSRGTLTLAGELRAGLCWAANSTEISGGVLLDQTSGFVFSNIGPVVDTGVDFPAKTGLPAALSGVVADDGLPSPPAGTDVSWELVSGPGTVDIAASSLAATTAVFSEAGTYQLRLTASDGAIRTFDEVTVTVTDPLPVVSVAATTPIAAETGAQPGTFTITRSVWLKGEITVQFTLSGTAENNLDYEEINGSIVIPENVTSVTLDVIPIGDGLVEGPETVVLTLDPGDYDIDGGPAVITLEDSNHDPEFSSATITAADATQGRPYAGSIVAFASDPDAGDTLVFSLVDGPAWLVVAPDGTLSGTPGAGDHGLATFTVRATDGGGAFDEAQLRINVIALPPFELWQFVKFGSRALDHEVAGALADPDFDGLSNLLEYALGNEPEVPDATPYELEIVNIDGSKRVRVTYLLNPAATDVTLAVEATSDPTDPASWSGERLLIEEQTASLLTVRDTLGGVRLFLRLKVTR